MARISKIAANVPYTIRNAILGCYYDTSAKEEAMEEGNITLLAVAIIGVVQMIISALLAWRWNKAAADKDTADARVSEESIYAGLVDRLERSLAAANEREEKRDARIAALEEKCEKYERLIERYEAEQLELQ